MALSGVEVPFIPHAHILLSAAAPSQYVILIESRDIHQAKNLIEDMFFGENIFEAWHLYLMNCSQNKEALVTLSS